MVFSSNFFLLVFLPVFLVVYYAVPYRIKNVWALIGSIFFYAWGAPLFIFVLLFSIGLDFFVVRQFGKGRDKVWLTVSLIGNIGLLAYFKYINFFVENANFILTKIGFANEYWPEVMLPIGISFFTFQKISYVVDVYRKVKAPLRFFSDHTLYVILFPQLIAGPIVRYSDIADELRERRTRINADNFLLGIFRFALGLGKKVLIANVVGAEADRIFSMGVDVSTSLAWYGALCYTFQIYFDFSGYSDMAIGIGRMLGFRFPENFNNPYVSKSITEFWRRWHITLSTWMRDYLYIPLGGSRVSKRRLYINLWTVFIFSGLWHGAAWTFVIWGAYHGLFLVIERAFLQKLYMKTHSLIRTGITFFIVVVGWVFFRASGWAEAKLFLSKMFAWEITPLMIPEEVEMALLVAVVFSFMALVPGIEKWQHRMLFDELSPIRSILYALLAVAILVICVSVIAASGFNPFIYFRF